ncbi:hypothetical protein ACU4GR_18665 [Methylobacterium oryzae CBMB20]
MSRPDRANGLDEAAIRAVQLESLVDARDPKSRRGVADGPRRADAIARARGSKS